MRLLIAILVAIVILLTAAWVAGAIYYSPIPNEALRTILAIGFVVGTIVIFALSGRRGPRLIGYFVIFAIIVVLWFQIPASNSRDWQPDVAMTPYATINGDKITIHNIRNFNYRSETDFDPHWETRVYDLSKLDSADLIAVYWAGKPIAHIMVSFGFGGKDYLAVSIETRKEKGEAYSTLAGFFRQYELYYVVADERDVIGVRTTYRSPQEQVYIYRVKGSVKNIRRVFLDYVRSINELREKPQFYNTLTTNCTTNVWLHTRINPESPPFSWKLLLSGYLPDYVYDLGRLDSTRPFAELEKLSLVNEQAHKADRDPAFSQRIREGLPMPAYVPAQPDA